jgi:hypothetical protein
MKKLILSSFIVAFSFSGIHAETAEELLRELEQLSGTDDTVQDIDDLGDLESMLNTLTESNNSNQIERSNNSTDNNNTSDLLDNLEREVEQPSSAFTQELPDDALSNLESFRQSFSPSSSSTYLKFIPVEADIAFNQTLIIPPTREFYVFSFGRSILMDDVNKNNFSLCYLQFRPSDKSRILQEGRTFPIVENNTREITVTSDPDSPVYVSTFLVDTPHINKIKCMSNQNDEPLTLNDFNQHFSNFISLRFPYYEEI